MNTLKCFSPSRHVLMRDTKMVKLYFGLIKGHAMKARQGAKAFVCAFAEMRKATVSVVISVRLSVCTHGTTLLPLDRFS